MIVSLPLELGPGAENEPQSSRSVAEILGRMDRWERVFAKVVIGFGITLAWLVLRTVSPWLSPPDIRVRWRRVKAPILTFTHPKSSRRVVLIGTAHIADEAYWRRLRAEINELEWQGAKVCYECVCRPSEAEVANLSQAEQEAYRGSLRYGELSKRLFELTGLQYQLRTLPYSAPGWVNTDVSWVELMRALRAVGLDDDRALIEEVLGWLLAHRFTVHLAPWAIDRILEVMPALSYVTSQWKSEDSFRRDQLIVEWRSDVGVQGIVEAARDSDVVSIWGAGHVPGIRARLLSLGYHEVGRPKWLVARRLTFFSSIVLRLPRLLRAG